MADHTGPGHGDATLSLAELKPGGAWLHQSWTVCDCTLPQLRARLGPPAWESLTGGQARKDIGQAMLNQPGDPQ